MPARASTVSFSSKHKAPLHLLHRMLLLQHFLRQRHLRRRLLRQRHRCGSRHALIRSSLTPRPVSRGWSAHPQKLLLQLMRPFRAKHGANLMLPTMEGATTAVATTCARLHLQGDCLMKCTCFGETACLRSWTCLRVIEGPLSVQQGDKQQSIAVCHLVGDEVSFFVGEQVNA